jgi:hypothetical protein
MPIVFPLNPSDGETASIETFTPNGIIQQKTWEWSASDNLWRASGITGEPLAPLSGLNEANQRIDGVENQISAITGDINQINQDIEEVKLGLFSNLNNSSSNSLFNVGCVVPMYIEANLTTTMPLTQGKWFVNFTAFENSSDGYDEDSHLSMAKIWTVPLGNFLRFRVSGANSSANNSGVSYIIGNSSSLSTTTLGNSTWQIISANATGNAKATLTNATAFDTYITDNTGIIYSVSNSPIRSVSGYAIRIS